MPKNIFSDYIVLYHVNGNGHLITFCTRNDALYDYVTLYFATCSAAFYVILIQLLMEFAEIREEDDSNLA